MNITIPHALSLVESLPVVWSSALPGAAVDEIFKFVFNPIFLAFAVTSLFFAILAFKLKSVGEWIFLAATICCFSYYYAPIYCAIDSELFSWADWLKSKISASLPATWPKTLAASTWPIWSMLICLSLRWGIYRFVRDSAMRRYARSYWFYVAACLSFICIFSDVAGINIMFLVALAITVPVFLMAGFHRILRDILWAFGSLLHFGFIVMNIGWRWIVAGATWLSKEVRRLWKWLLRSFWAQYENLLAGPVRRLGCYINELLAAWLAKVQEWTDKLSIKPPPSH